MLKASKSKVMVPVSDEHLAYEVKQKKYDTDSFI